jgi:AsmA protein
MSKTFKVVFGLIAVIVTLIIAAVIILPLVIDPNDYKDEIAAQVKQATGRDLEVRERLELSVFPSIAVSLGGVSLSNAEGFGEDNFAQVEELDLKVALMPLLSGSLEVDTVVLRGLQLNLAKNKNGRTNWDDLAGEGGKKPKEAEPVAGAPTDKQLAINIQGIIIERAKLVWDDRQSGKRYELDDLHLKTGAIGSGKRVPLDLGLKLISKAPAQQFDLSVVGDVTADDSLKHFQISGLVVGLSAGGEDLPDKGIDLELKSAVDFDAGAGRIALTDLKLAGPELELSGSVTGEGLNATPRFQGKLKLAESNLKQLMALGGTVPETADAAAMTKVSAEFGIAASDKSTALKPFAIQLDDSSLTGEFNITSFEGPAVNFALNLDQIDLDRYLPPKTVAGAEAGTTDQPDSKSAKTAGDPLAPLRTLNLNGKIHIGKLKVNNLNTSNIQLALKANGGVLEVSPITADLYQGKVNGSIAVDARKKEPLLKIKNTLAGIEIGPLLKDLSGNERLTGKGGVNIDLNMTGLAAESIKKTLNGDVNFKFKDGAYKGMDIIGTICSVSDKIGSLLKGGAGELNQSGETKFSEMGGSANIVNGVVTNEDLNVKSPLLRVQGTGNVDLPQDRIDYLVNAELVAACEGQTGAGAEQLVGVPLPIRAKGALAEPKLSPDWGALGQQLAQSEVKSKAEALIKDKIPLPSTGEDSGSAADAVGGALKKGLKDLF